MDTVFLSKLIGYRTLGSDMWLVECDSFAELCRGYLPYYLLIVLPIFIIISPVNPVAASHEFPVYRMHQYDLHGVPHGKIIIIPFFSTDDDLT